MKYSLSYRKDKNRCINKKMSAQDMYKIISKQVSNLSLPWVTRLSNIEKDAFKILISCVLSIRTKDRICAEVTRRLFRYVSCPDDIIKMSVAKLEKLIYPVGFYRNKARMLVSLSKDIVKRYNRSVPKELDKLLILKGVGRKCANLVLGLGFGIPAICVDTHVHRISNRLGWIKTDNVIDTENILQTIFPKRWWIGLNTVLVSFGQNICLPVSPRCSLCMVNIYCPRIGVRNQR